MQIAAVILAAGKGTRMKSELPKVLHKVCGRPMLNWVLEAVKESGIKKIVLVAGFKGDLIAETVDTSVQVVYQNPQLGTAHALLQAEKALANFPGHILVVAGDVPLITSATLSKLINNHENSGAAATVLTAHLDDPSGYGRVIRDKTGKVIKIVEQTDASSEELSVHEVNTGIYCFSVEGLFETLAGIKAENTQGEYYLTDLIEAYVQAGLPVAACQTKDPVDIQGVNDRCQLASVEAIMRHRIREKLMLSGVTIMDPSSTFIDQEAIIGRDSIIYPFTIIEGATVIGPRCIIGPGTHLVKAQIGKEVSITHSVIYESIIGDYCSVGPFAYIRPGCVLKKGVKIGDFVEIKKSTIGENSKVPHLSYIGDATIGCHVNIGAGTITCNYDGEKKWPTYIGDNAFIGSNTNLVAPVEVGSEAVIAAGSTITKNVPAQALGVARNRQRNILQWVSKRKPVEK